MLPRSRSVSHWTDTAGIPHSLALWYLTPSGLRHIRTVLSRDMYVVNCKVGDRIVRRTRLASESRPYLRPRVFQHKAHAISLFAGETRHRRSVFVGGTVMLSVHQRQVERLPRRSHLPSGHGVRQPVGGHAAFHVSQRLKSLPLSLSRSQDRNKIIGRALA